MLIYDSRPDARAALTLRVTAAVPSVNDITCATTPADLIEVFDGRPADLVFIGVDHQAGDGEDTVALFLRRYPTATVIVVGTINDIPALTTALARGAVGLMLWHPWHDHPRLPPPAIEFAAEPEPHGDPRRTRNPAGHEPRPVQP